MEEQHRIYMFYLCGLFFGSQFWFLFVAIITRELTTVHRSRPLARRRTAISAAVSDSKKSSTHLFTRESQKAMSELNH